MSVNDFTPAEVFHPGEYLREEIAARKLKIKPFAQSIGISPAQLRAICSEKEPMTLTVAVKVCEVWGTACETWINLQEAYSVGQLRQLRRDLITWAEMHGELDAVWVQSDLSLAESDIAATQAMFVRMKKIAKRTDKERGHQ